MVNKVLLVGNVGADPEIKYLENDVSVARIRIATSESYKNKAGEKITNTEWHNVTLWRGLAKVTENYVKKGSLIYIEGKLTYRSYEKDGETKYFTEIVANEMKLLGRKGDSENDNNQQQYENASVGTSTANEADALDMTPSDTDDLPF